MGVFGHRKAGLADLDFAILTVSTTRTLATDKSGAFLAKEAEKEGHKVVSHEVIPDDFLAIGGAVLDLVRTAKPDVIIVTGGTGITQSDVTIEAVRPLLHKELTAFGPLFAQLSHQEIGAAAMLSRATAGLIGESVVYCIPGSLGACKLAAWDLIFPEVGHLLAHARTA